MGVTGYMRRGYVAHVRCAPLAVFTIGLPHAVMFANLILPHAHVHMQTHTHLQLVPTYACVTMLEFSP